MSQNISVIRVRAPASELPIASPSVARPTRQPTASHRLAKLCSMAAVRSDIENVTRCGEARGGS